MGSILVKFRVSLKMGKVSNYLGAGPGPGCPTSVKIAAKLGNGTSQDLEYEANLCKLMVKNGYATRTNPAKVVWDRRGCDVGPTFAKQMQIFIYHG